MLSVNGPCATEIAPKYLMSANEKIFWFVCLFVLNTGWKTLWRFICIFYQPHEKMQFHPNTTQICPTCH